MGKLLAWGSGPDHLTIPLIVPELATETTLYSLLWPVTLSAPVSSNANEIATTTFLSIYTSFDEIVLRSVTWNK
jgi:hypothetical protein